MDLSFSGIFWVDMDRDLFFSYLFNIHIGRVSMKKVICRGPVDELVFESGFSGKLIAQKMGIAYNKMVALRRAANIDSADIARVKEAIVELKKECPEKAKYVKPEFVVTEEQKDLAAMNASLSEEVLKCREEIKAYRNLIETIEGLFAKNYYQVCFHFEDQYGHVIDEKKTVLAIHALLAVRAVASEYKEKNFSFVSVEHVA